MTLAPSSFMRKTLSAWRSMSSAPMYTSHGRPSSAHAVALAGGVGLLQLDERRHQGLRHEAPAEAAEVPARVGQRLHDRVASAMKRRTLSGSFLPGRVSTPEFTSTA